MKPDYFSYFMIFLAVVLFCLSMVSFFYIFLPEELR